MDAEEQRNAPPRIASSTILFKLLPFLVLAISLATTFAMWRMLDNGFKQEAQHDFKDKTKDIVFLINEVLRDHEQVLRGGVGLFNTNDNATRDQWHRYVSTQQFNRIHPGIVSVGYAAWLNPKEKQSHVREIRAEGFPEYRIRPEGERLFYSAITYLEPFIGLNRLAIGYDMYSEPIRRRAMERARTKGLTTLASGITFDQETEQQNQQGMVMYLPVYRQGAPLLSMEQRQTALKGFVFSPIKVKEFIYGTLGSLPTEIAFEIFDGETSRADKLMFSSLASEKLSLPGGYQPDLSSTQKIEEYGRTWTITFKTLPSFTHEFHRVTSRAALGAGILVSLLLATITYTLQTTRDRALVLARGMTKELGESEETMRLILNTAGEAIYGIDTNGCCTFCNPATLLLLGYGAEEELLGRNMHNLAHHSHSDGTEYHWQECPISRVIETNAGRHLDDTQFRRRNGESFPVECWSMPKYKDGRVIGAVVSFIDITRRKQSESAVKKQAEQLRQEVTERREAQLSLLHHQRELEALNQALEERVAGEVKQSRIKDQALVQHEKMASIGQLAAGVAHEINTPMAFISSNLSILSRYFDQLSLDNEQANGSSMRDTGGVRKSSLSTEQILADGVDLIAESLEGAERVTRIVQDLKSFSRVDVPEYELTDMTSCLESALTIAHSQLESVATFRREYESVPRILSHPGQLNQLFLNLLINAGQAIIAPGEITLRTWHDDSFVYASVSDTGGGIPEGIRDRIFNPFFTTRDVGQGIGMGLSISYEIVKNHDGSLLVESEIGKGSTFTVILPFTPDEDKFDCGALRSSELTAQTGVT